MGKFTRKEFAAKCGVTPKYIATYVGRGKVIVGKDKLVDDTVPQNLEFLLARTVAPAEDETEATAPKEKFNEADKKKRIVKVHAPEGENAAVTRKYNLEIQQKELVLKEQEQKVELNAIKLQKQKGEVIPTELAMLTFSQHFKSLTTSLYQAADNIIGSIAAKHQLSIEERAVLRGELKEIINKAVAEGVESSKNSVENIAEEYSKTRARGEKR